MILIKELLDSLQGAPGFSEPAFVEAHSSVEQVTSIRVNPFKRNTEGASIAELEQLPAETLSAVPWCANGYYLAERPSFTFDPLFHAGCYYVQEASSMFLEQVIKTCFPGHSTAPLKVLDLCAAPGGKATHLSALFPAGLVVANEAIGSRAGILVENAIRWGSENMMVTCNDPSVFRKLEGFFDLIVVDAPCSGSGMLRKDPEVMNEWSQAHVAHCSKRQRRILEDGWPALKEGGVLVYATCSYSKEENEDITDWLSATLQAVPVSIPLHPEWGIVESISPLHNCNGYRFYPYNLKGEGLYIACFRKTSNSSEMAVPLKKMPPINRASVDILADAVADPAYWCFTEEQEAYRALPAAWSETINALKSVLHVKKAGVTLGKIIKKLLIPDHELAAGNLVSDRFQCLELGKAQAIEYLQKKNITVSTALNGWCLITYKGFRLGWAKILPNRINNYYPQRFRILKPSPPSL